MTGKWTLGRTNSYTGDTIVEEGVLGVARASLDDQATVSIAAGAVMSLEFFGRDAIGALVVGGPATTGPFAFNYGLSAGWENWKAWRRDEIVNSMNGAVALYNRHGHFPKADLNDSSFVPGTLRARRVAV